MRVHLLMTGNELMSGVTVDSNSSMIARALEPFDLRIAGKVTIGDDLALLRAEIDRLCAQSDVLIVNGGLGPTRDDLTAQALAETAGVALVEHPAALAHLEGWCARRGIALNAANRKQSILPAGVELLANAVGSAVGFRLRHRGCEVLCTPGVPSELRAMLTDAILPWFELQFPGREPVTITRFQLFGIGESALQQCIDDACPDWPETVELGFRAGAPTLELKVSSFRAADAAARIACEQRIEALVGDCIIGRGETSLQRGLVEALTAHGQRLVTAESCTGGLIAALLTEVPGASAVFEAGFVTYSNRMKQDLLGVDPALIATEGAVSEAVVRAMAAGALARSGADHVVAVSGVAGPDGGTPQKPVGLVWIAWGARDDIRAQPLFYPHGRKLFQTLAAAAALDLVRRRVLGITGEPRYFRDRCPPR